MPQSKKIAIIGSTGSIGTQALDVIKQAIEFKPNAVVIGDESKYQMVKDVLFKEDIKVYAGDKAIEQIVEMETIDMIFPAIWGVEKCISDSYKAVGFRCWPHKIKGEGFFIAALKKKDGGVANQHIPSFEKLASKKLPIINNWIHNDGHSYFMHKEDVHIAPSNFINDIPLLQKNLYVKKAGINCGTFKGDHFIPHHQLAVSNMLHNRIQKIHFSKEDALTYLRKNDLAETPAGKGWALASYNNLGLGWMKILPNRINNYYPVEWRILKQ